MKKLLALALVALLGSSVHAVAWTEYAAGSSSGSSSLSTNVWAGSSATLTAFITYGSTLGTGELFGLYRAEAGAGCQVTVSLNSDGAYVLSIAGTDVTSSSTVTASTNGTDAVSVTLYRTSGSASNTTTYNNVDLYVNGTLVASVTDLSSGNGPLAYLQWGAAGNATYDMYYTQGSGSNAYYASAEAIATAMGDVPEPTALALLALGVAGIALKRRAA